MRIIKALKVFDDLKKKGVIRDYAVGGAVAMTYYVEPRATRDVDIFLLADYEEHKLTWDILDKLGYKYKEGIVIEDIPVDIVPSFQHPFYSEAIRKSKKVRMDNILVKIFTPEYLIATKLLVFRGKDRIDIFDLFRYVKVNLPKLETILHGGFKGEAGLLLKRLHKILEEED